MIGTNDPARGIPARDRVLSDLELTVIWKACQEDDFGRIIRLLMFTGCRRDEIGGLEWAEIDLAQSTLSIPGRRTKNHHPLFLTLPRAALSVLQATPVRPGRAYLFGQRGGPFSRWAWEKLALDKRLAEAGHRVPPWRLHDIRRTVATGLAELGVQPHIIEAILNHRSGHKAGVAGIYNRATYEAEIRRALAIWAEHLLAVVEGRKAVLLPMVQRSA